MDMHLLKRISKHMAWLLRHEPQRAGLVLDGEGYVRLDELAEALRCHIPEVDIGLIHEVVAVVEPAKQRYSIEGDFVRANYGHSTLEQIRHPAVEPPAILFHGTSRGSIEVIRTEGLKPMRRQYVHLTNNPELALSVGARHGTPHLVRIDAAGAHASGVQFHHPNPAFWLVSAVPPHFLDLR
jgi:putative RNA 2'-phosphotransferase